MNGKAFFLALCAAVAMLAVAGPAGAVDGTSRSTKPRCLRLGDFPSS